MTKIIEAICLMLIVNGGVSTLVGITGGATGLLSGNAPWWLAVGGVGAMYLAMVLYGLISLWEMDE